MAQPPDEERFMNIMLRCCTSSLFNRRCLSERNVGNNVNKRMVAHNQQSTRTGSWWDMVTRTEYSWLVSYRAGSNR